MTDNPDEDTTAAELALGVLEADERAAAMRRVLADPEFAREVERWRSHFAALIAEVEAVDPPAALLTRIEAALSPKRPRGFLWPAVAAALAASLIAALLMRPVVAPPPITPAATLVATLAPAANGTLSAVYDVARAEIRISKLSGAPAGRSNELWLIGGDGVPRSLGLLGLGDASSVPVAAVYRSAVKEGARLAISSEPPGGSRTGQPTGPIVATGTFISL